MDLLPLYFSGEASPDTAELIAGFLAKHPELGPAIETQRRAFAAQHDLLAAGAVPAPDHELRTLTRTRSLMERLKWQMAMALLLTGLPLSFTFHNREVTFMVLRDQPLMAAMSWAGAAVLWALYWRTRRRLQLKGI
jgi:hypothetical protein